MADIKLPKVIFGTSGLGNLYVALPDDVKLAIVSECLAYADGPAVFDSAGKYGAGLALESLGKCLSDLSVSPGDVMISNKLGWLRTELKSAEPTFEPGVWKGLSHDAVQKINYDGILECYAQGNELLGDYQAKMVSVHDPDEYLAAASTADERTKRYHDILEAYVALSELKANGQVSAIGIGAKNWRVIEEISKDVQLDWVMFANSLTIHSHPRELLQFMKKLQKKEVKIINSAIFNAGFLTGSDCYNYEFVSRDSRPDLYAWRDLFYQVCAKYDLVPAAVCAAFVFLAPGVQSIALNTTNPNRVKTNTKLKDVYIPPAFWLDMQRLNLIDPLYQL